MEFRRDLIKWWWVWPGGSVFTCLLLSTISAPQGDCTYHGMKPEKKWAWTGSEYDIFQNCPCLLQLVAHHTNCLNYFCGCLSSFKMNSGQYKFVRCASFLFNSFEIIWSFLTTNSDSSYHSCKYDGIWLALLWYMPILPVQLRVIHINLPP